MAEMTPEYFEKMLDAKFQHIHSEITDLKTNSVEILKQIKYANGRTTDLEKWRASQEGRQGAMNDNNKTSQWRIAMVVAILSTIGTILANKILHIY